MHTPKFKEPLVAMLLAFILPGLGQIYSGRYIRGIIFFCIRITCGVMLLLNQYNPFTTFSFYEYVLYLLAIALYIFSIVDAYYCARAYNISNNLNKSLTLGKRIKLITCMLCVALGLNPGIILTVPFAIYLRTNVVQRFKIPGECMSPALISGDKVLIDKMIYKKSQPQRGDVVVFSRPGDRKKTFAYRLVGLPGETLTIAHGQLIINGKPVIDNSLPRVYYYNKGDFAKPGELVLIPPDCYFVLGDNGEKCKDSRIWGFVPRKNLVGKVYKIYSPFHRLGPVK